MVDAILALWQRIFPEPAPAVADALRLYQMRQFQKQVPVLHVVAAFNTAIVIAASWRDGIAPLHLVFPALIIAFSAWRISVWRRRGARDVPVQDIPRLLTAAAWAIVVAVGLASSWTVWTFVTGAFSQPELVPISLAIGMFCVAHCLGALPVAAIIALVLGTVPIALVMLGSHMFLPFALGWTILSGIVFQARIVRDHYLQTLTRLLLEAKVRDQAHTDELTGLPNRRAFMDALDRAMVDACSAKPIALAIIDLDGFKRINDTLGHAAGDAVLHEVGQRLAASLGKGDSAGRLGGDEFVVLFGADSVQMIEARTAAIIATLGNAFEFEGCVLPLSASLGYALAPRDARRPSLMLAAADQALYAAKAAGKGCAHSFKPSGGVPSRSDRRAALEKAA
jgi:diguanylate cyclase